MKIISYLLLMCCGVAQAIEYADVKLGDLPGPAVKIVRDGDNNFQDVMMREWTDRVYTDEGTQQYVYQQGYDYSKKEGYIRVLDLQGNIVREEYSAKTDGGVSREETQLAFELFKAHPEIQKQLQNLKEKIYIYGGFNYLDQKSDQACYSGNRCVHIFASTISNPLVAHAVVRLNDKTIPYPEYDTDPVVMELLKGRLKKRDK
ncbi:hypothetical protein [Marinicella sp. W31]|uniref:hypothetical protein n=1 Tax=Marinicella sp. W31 TaxID=3023713 RepID=UPI0037572AC2